MPHLLVDISAHGYGHIAQTAPVVNELARRFPGLRITLRSAATTTYLQQSFTCPFQHIQTALDFGMAMFNAVEVDVPRSLAAYREYHRDWETKVAHAADEMCALQPDVLFANVPYLSLAAAQAAGIPSVAMCCLNWADIYRHYAPHDAESQSIHTQMMEAYNSAQLFLKVQPTMPMPGLHNALEIAPIAQLGSKNNAGMLRSLPLMKQLAIRLSTIKLCKSLVIPPGEGWGGGSTQKLILVAMGGIDYRLPMENWPRIQGLCWLIPQAWNIQREDMVALESLGMSFSDVLASADAVLTKPGYGTFAEAACSGVPVLYVSRGEWPEQPYLVQWLQQNGVCREVGIEQLRTGDLSIALEQLWGQAKPELPRANGAAEAAEYLAGKIRKCRLG
ncbi:MAG: hypothetical protein AAB278_07440 [Pseudomonadota bacterium]|mgnify:CR=1 FL=1